MSKNSIIYPSIDTPDLEKAIHFAGISTELKQGLKLGLEFFNANGPQGVEKIRDKYHSPASLINIFTT